MTNDATQVITVRIPSELLEWLTEQASAEDRSRNYIITRLLQRAREAAESAR